MKTEAKKNLLAASLYIALAVMIVTIVSITVLSVAKKAKEALPSETQGVSEAPIAPRETDRPGTAAPTDMPSLQEPTQSSTEDKNTVASPSEDANDTPVDVPTTDVMPDSFTLPCNGYISKGYEPDLPVWSNTMEDYRIHEGIDVVCEDDAEIYACADGTVESIYEDPLMGYSITVYHGGGLRSTYMGLADEYPKSVGTGTKVTKGQVLGWVGDSALIECSEPKHLHFVMTMEGETVDPLNYVEYETATMNEYE